MPTELLTVISRLFVGALRTTVGNTVGIITPFQVSERKSEREEKRRGEDEVRAKKRHGAPRSQETAPACLKVVTLAICKLARALEHHYQGSTLKRGK